MVSPNAHLRLIDRPCGTGKTTKLLKGFKDECRYLVVLPTLAEVERVIQDANVAFTQPEPTESDDNTKRDHLASLLALGNNIATTHKLYQEIVILARRGLLNDYHIYIDEVLEVCGRVPGKTPTSFQQFYIDSGYATVDQEGKVSATLKWDAHHEDVSDTLSSTLYRSAKANMLHYVDGTFFMWALPQDLLTAGLSVTILTYLAMGSTLVAYLDKLGIPYSHDVDKTKDAAFIARAKNLITVEVVPGMEKLNLNYSGQTSGKAIAATVSKSLRKLRRGPLKEVPLEHVLITCVQANWYLGGKNKTPKQRPGNFAKGARMFDGVKWAANTTRGTNDFIDTTHMIYLYEQNMNPFIKRWLGLGSDKVAQDRYALTELIQWVYRSRVRRGEPVTLYLPSKRMRRVLQRWMDGDVMLSN